MRQSLRRLRFSAAALMLAAGLAAASSSDTFAQTTSTPTTTTAGPSQSVIKALQEALNKQGQTVETNGVFDDATRNALRRFQTQHHLPVTGEADQATLGKLGVANHSAPSTSTVAQAPSSGSTSSPQAPAQESGVATSGMMSGPMMQKMMQGMMQTMHGMMGMMQSEMQSRQMGPGPMRRSPMQGPSDSTTSDCPMMSDSQMPAPAMRQMMQGMMQMMRTMQNQMQPDQKSQSVQ